MTEMATRKKNENNAVVNNKNAKNRFSRNEKNGTVTTKSLPTFSSSTSSASAALDTKSFQRPHGNQEHKSSSISVTPYMNCLHVWQVVAPPHVDQVEFWNAVLSLSRLRLKRKSVLFILDMPIFPRALNLLVRSAPKRWKVMFTFSESDRLKTWKILTIKGAPPSVDVIVMDHVIPSLFTQETITQLELKSPQLEALIIRTPRKLPLFTNLTPKEAFLEEKIWNSRELIETSQSSVQSLASRHEIIVINPQNPRKL